MAFTCNLFHWNCISYDIYKFTNKIFIYVTAQNTLMRVIRLVINEEKFDHLSILRFGSPTFIHFAAKMFDQLLIIWI